MLMQDATICLMVNVTV